MSDINGRTGRFLNQNFMKKNTFNYILNPISLGLRNLNVLGAYIRVKVAKVNRGNIVLQFSPHAIGCQPVRYCFT